MRHARSLGFDALEARKLLTAAHAVARRAAAHAVARTPVAVSGTLAVDLKGETSVMNQDSGSTVSVPVSGQLGALGEVRGYWNETVDQFGEDEGPGTLLVRNAEGSLLIVLNNNVEARPHKDADGTISYDYSQRLYSGSGAYAHATESGWVVTTTNAAKTQVQSLTLT